MSLWHNDKLIPNLLLDLRLMPLFMVEHFVIAFNPNDPKRNAFKEVPNFDHLPYFLGILSPNNTCFQLKLS